MSAFPAPGASLLLCRMGSGQANCSTKHGSSQFPSKPPHLGTQFHLLAQKLHERLVADGWQHCLIPQPHLQL